ncbi:unnamed protein product [Leptidea sinapis]|uniref:Uncharacterized protein n=1 Tax=Leptidea sinapis TaxID=189913 RepID=A0A5E4Q3Z1_9NEOP|nr:unnamed protein product [Leptidea sinapis]VVC92254.1 unnamed protein product [Leptidea sinapis]
MVKHRKLNAPHKHGNSSETSASSGGNNRSKSKTYKYLTTTIGVICLVIAVYIGTLGYLETRVNTPFDGEKLSSNRALMYPKDTGEATGPEFTSG